MILFFNLEALFSAVRVSIVSPEALLTTINEFEIFFGRKYPFVKWNIGNIELSIAMQERFLDFNTILVKYI